MPVRDPTMPTTTWEFLERRVDELIELTALLSKENRALKIQQQNWTTERAKLIEKNELAKSRVEAMITRLKSLEQD
jgi:cell division protein ZapB